MTTDWSQLAYVPIAKPSPHVPVEDLLAFERDHAIVHFTPCWSVLPIVAPLARDEDCHSQELVDRGWMGRYDENYPIASRWLFESDKRFPQLKEFLESLPFRRLSHCNILRQVEPVPPHIDYDPRLEPFPHQGALRDFEPASYKVLLHGSHLNSFYICDRFKMEERHFPKYPERHNCFAISEEVFWHGAEYFPGEPKYVVSVFGLLDRERHRRLIAESLEKFSDHAIWLAPTPT